MCDLDGLIVFGLQPADDNILDDNMSGPSISEKIVLICMKVFNIHEICINFQIFLALLAYYLTGEGSQYPRLKSVFLSVLFHITEHLQFYNNFAFVRNIDSI